MGTVRMALTVNSTITQNQAIGTVPKTTVETNDYLMAALIERA